MEQHRNKARSCSQLPAILLTAFPRVYLCPPSPQTLQQIENAIFHLQFFLSPLQLLTQPTVMGRSCFSDHKPLNLNPSPACDGWVGLTPGVDGSCGLNPAAGEPVPCLRSQGDPSSGLPQEQSVQVESVTIPFLPFTWAYLEQVGASHRVGSPNCRAECLFSDTLSGPLCASGATHPIAMV